MRLSFFTAIILFLVSSDGRAQVGSTGHWEGDIQVAGTMLVIRVDLSPAGDSLRGTIDIPQQNAVGLSLRAVRVEKERLSFELPAGPGVAGFDGTVRGDTAWGVFRQAGMTGTFHLRREAMKISRPAVSAIPPPYVVQEVNFSNGEISLAGTLTHPSSQRPHPAVILLTGSGPQTRDEDIFGFSVFATLADTLTRSGMAVLRFDDRGVGGSTGSLSEATTRDYASDALAAFTFLSTHPAIDKTKIGILGHSEGGAAACFAAAREPAVAFLVLMAGPSVPGDRLILDQIETLGRQAGMPAAEIQDNMSLQRRVYDVLRSDIGWDSLRLLLARHIQRRSPGADSLVRLQVEGQIRVMRSRWFRSFIDLDPATALREVFVPILALLGEKDMQVPPATNRAVFEALREKEGRKNLTVVVIPGANHLFQNAGTGHPGEYAVLKKEFSGEFIGALISWVAKHAGLQH